MRKALIAAIVAAALFAVGAFAADFTLNSEDVASGTDGVTACASEVDVDFDTVYSATASDWEVASADITFFDTAGAATSACDGFGATLAVELADGSVVFGEASVGGTSAAVNLDATVVAAEIDAASVLVDGLELNVPTPGGGDGDVGVNDG